MQISNKTYNETMSIVSNYLSWEQDTHNIKSALRLWADFEREVTNKSKNVMACRALLLKVIENNAS